MVLTDSFVAWVFENAECCSASFPSFAAELSLCLIDFTYRTDIEVILCQQMLARDSHSLAWLNFQSLSCSLKKSWRAVRRGFLFAQLGTFWSCGPDMLLDAFGHLLDWWGWLQTELSCLSCSWQLKQALRAFIRSVIPFYWSFLGIRTFDSMPSDPCSAFLIRDPSANMPALHIRVAWFTSG